MRFSRRPEEDTGLLRMTNWVAEIATSSNQKTVGFLAMTEQEKKSNPPYPFLVKRGDWFLNSFFSSSSRMLQNNPRLSDYLKRELILITVLL